MKKILFVLFLTACGPKEVTASTYVPPSCSNDDRVALAFCPVGGGECQMTENAVTMFSVIQCTKTEHAMRACCNQPIEDKQARIVECVTNPDDACWNGKQNEHGTHFCGVFPVSTNCTHYMEIDCDVVQKSGWCN